MSANVPASAGLRRDLDLLRELASEESVRRGGLGVIRLSERLGREKSQVSRALRALEAEGMVERDPSTRTYQLGWGLYALAARGVESRLVRAAVGRLQQLAEEQQSRCSLCVLIGGQVITLFTTEPGRSGVLEQEEPAVAVTASAAGTALVLDWQASGAPRIDATAAERDALAERYGKLMLYGYSMFDYGHERGFAAPVRDFRGVVLAAIELYSAGGDPDERGRATVAAARSLSRDLGYDEVDTRRA
ncbi:MAG TPA: helix-turn-helix domain-containing protein [Mycobacteriales bacterium]|nr:helix-turn-helix domain-containing protein [Mycobacteriales bacterium]